MFNIRNPRNGQGLITTARQTGGSVLKFSDLAANRQQQMTTASGFAGPGASGGNVNIGSLATGINLDPMLYEVLPEQIDEDQFPPQLMQIYRDIYYFDSVAGATIDLYSTLPFSNFTLAGMKPDELAKFDETCQRLNIEQLLPALTIDYMVHGAFLGNLLYARKDRVFTDILCMQPEHCKFTSMPFFGQDPIIEYTVPDKLKKFINMKSPRVQATMARMGNSLAAKFKKGKFELSPLTTLFIPRSTMTGRLGTSVLKRILPIYLVEKSLWKGTMIESTRRIRAIMHIMVGDSEWEPTNEQIAMYGSLFTEADSDPLGAIVATRAGVNTQDVRPGGDFWNIFNIWGETVPAKLRALGVSEAFLSGDASYNNMETSLSTFIDGLRQYRAMITDKVFYSRLFPLISLVNNFVKDGKKLPRELRNLKGDGTVAVEDLMRALQDTSALKTPEIKWTKTLEPKGDASYFELLTTMEEKGVPVGIRAWAAAGGLNLEEAIASSQEDIKLREQIAKLAKERDERLSKYKKDDGGDGDGAKDDEGDDETFQGEFAERARIIALRKANKADTRFRTAASIKPVGIMNRDYGEMSELRKPGKSGNTWHSIPNQRRAQKKANDNIVKAMRNISKRGR